MRTHIGVKSRTHARGPSSPWRQDRGGMRTENSVQRRSPTRLLGCSRRSAYAKRSRGPIAPPSGTRPSSRDHAISIGTICSRGSLCCFGERAFRAGSAHHSRRAFRGFRIWSENLPRLGLVVGRWQSYLGITRRAGEGRLARNGAE